MATGSVITDDVPADALVFAGRGKLLRKIGPKPARESAAGKKKGNSRSDAFVVEHVTSRYAF